MEKRERSIFTEWLERLQQDSWQLELLISGFALLSLYQGRSLIHDIRNYTILNNYGYTGGILLLVSILIAISWKIFFVNLSIHVVIRGLWIGTIGLRYISGDLDYENLNFSKYFTSFFKSNVGSFDTYIEKIEKFCSILFAYTFLLFFFLISLLGFSLTLFLFTYLLDSIQTNWIHDIVTIILLMHCIISLIILFRWGDLKK